jgi:hypothetical protein
MMRTLILSVPGGEIVSEAPFDSDWIDSFFVPVENKSFTVSIRFDNNTLPGGQLIQLVDVHRTHANCSLQFWAIVDLIRNFLASWCTEGVLFSPESCPKLSIDIQGGEWNE